MLDLTALHEGQIRLYCCPRQRLGLNLDQVTKDLKKSYQKQLVMRRVLYIQMLTTVALRTMVFGLRATGVGSYQNCYCFDLNYVCSQVGKRRSYPRGQGYG